MLKIGQEQMGGRGSTASPFEKGIIRLLFELVRRERGTVVAATAFLSILIIAITELQEFQHAHIVHST